MKKILMVMAMATLPFTVVGCGGDDSDDGGGGGGFCQAGELDCACTPALPSGCNSDEHQCVEGICIACTPGEMGCVCEAGACTDGSTCDANALCM